MGKRYVVELELDEEQVAALEQAQGLAGELRALLMESAGALRGYGARRGQIEGLHERLSGLTPTLGWMLLEGRVAPSDEVRQDLPTREVAAVPRKRPAPPAPAAQTPTAQAPAVIELKRAPIMAINPAGEEVQLAQVVTPPPAAELQETEEVVPATLPATASPLPFIGLLGLVSLGAGFAARAARRRLS